MTNNEKINNMNVEEKAEWICELLGVTRKTYPRSYSKFKQSKIKWLNSEVENNG